MGTSKCLNVIIINAGVCIISISFISMSQMQTMYKHKVCTCCTMYKLCHNCAYNNQIPINPKDCLIKKNLQLCVSRFNDVPIVFSSNQ